MLQFIQLLLNGISLGSVYTLISLGFTLIFSVLNFSNFSHGGVMVVAAYFGYLVAKHFGLDLYSTLIVTGVFGGCLSAFVQVIGFERLRRTNAETMLYFVSASTLGTLLQNAIAVTFSSTYYSYPAFFEQYFFEFFGLTLAVTDTMMLVISTFFILLLMFLLYKTRLGVSIRALSQDPVAARLNGVNVSLVILMCFFISGVLAAISGVFLGINYVLQPTLANMVMKGFTASILGGLGNITGALYGGLILGVAEVFLIYFVGSGFAPVVVFFLTIAFLIWRPQGISGKFVPMKV